MQRLRKAYKTFYDNVIKGNDLPELPKKYDFKGQKYQEQGPAAKP